MSKPDWSGSLSKFGRYLKAHKIERETIAEGLDITPSYVSMIAHAKARPSFKLAMRIAVWTAKHVKKDGQPAPFPVESWA